MWWPTLVIYEEGKEIWRGKVPNPPSFQPLKDLERILDEKTAAA